MKVFFFVGHEVKADPEEAESLFQCCRNIGKHADAVGLATD